MHPGRTKPIPFTDQEHTLLKKLAADGMSASQISMEFRAISQTDKNIHLRSRNSLISHCHRRNVSLARAAAGVRNNGRKMTAEEQELQNKRIARQEVLQKFSPRKTGSKDPYKPKDRAERPRPIVTIRRGLQPETGLGISLLDLSEKTCKWPIGGERMDMSFCGHTPFAHFPYCEAHASKAFDHNNLSKRNPYR